MSLRVLFWASELYRAQHVGITMLDVKVQGRDGAKACRTIVEERVASGFCRDSGECVGGLRLELEVGLLALNNHPNCHS